MKHKKVKNNSEIADKLKSTIIQYQRTFGTPEGKAVLHDLMANYHVFSGTFDKDPLTMAFREGSRFVIMDILSKLNTDPNEFVEMFEENLGATY